MSWRLFFRELSLSELWKKWLSFAETSTTTIKVFKVGDHFWPKCSFRFVFPKCRFCRRVVFLFLWSLKVHKRCQKTVRKKKIILNIFTYWSGKQKHIINNALLKPYLYILYQKCRNLVKRCFWKTIFK